jgi:cytochrome c-type biogenesis protein CcmE
VARQASPARLVFAVSIAAVLAIFLLYVSVAGGTPSVQPSQLKDHKGKVALVGKVVGPQRGDAHAAGMRFRLRDVEGGGTTVPVLYRGSVPDQFKPGREIRLEGHLWNGVFVGKPGTLVTKCPSKYTAEKRA